MASMTYGVSKNGIKGIEYDYYEKFDYEKEDKSNTLHSYFVSAGSESKVKEKGKISFFS